MAQLSGEGGGLLAGPREGAAEGAGAVYSGEEEAEGGPDCSLQLPERRGQ